MSTLEPSQIKQILLYALPVAGLFLLSVGLLALRMTRKPREELTPEEKQAILEDKALLKAIIAETQKLCRDVPESLAIQNSMVSYYRVKPGAAGRRRRLLRFDAAIVTRTEIWFHFYGRGLPQGVSFADIKDPRNRVLDNLQYAIRRPCRFYEDGDFNLYLRVGLKYALYGIPKRFEWSTAFDALPKTRPLTLALGLDERGNVVYEDLRRWPHILVAGATRQGKSTQIIQWIITLIKRNTPDQVRFIFVDLKEGVELNIFREIPHCIAFVEEPDQVQSHLDGLLVEYKKRMEKIKAKGVANLEAYNAAVPAALKLPYIILIVDELADLMLDKTLASKAVDTFVKLARKARAAGIHMILATQIVEAQVLTLQIRGNFPARLAFAVPGINESTLILNNSGATTLEIPGRCVYKTGAEHKFLQAPIASDAEIRATIEAVSQPAPPQPTLNDHIFKTIWYNLAGQAPHRLVWEVMGGDVGKNTISRVLKEHEYDPEKQGPVITLDGMRFILYPGHRIQRGVVPRHLLPLNGHDLPTTKEQTRELYQSLVTDPAKNGKHPHTHTDEEE